MSGLNRWASAALVTVGASGLVGAYTLLFNGSPVVAENRLATPYVVVATPAPGHASLTAPAQNHAGSGKIDLGMAHPGQVWAALPGDAAAAARLAAALDDAEIASDADDNDDADGIEPANVAGGATQVVAEAPAAAWLRRLEVARVLLRQGAAESGRRSLERIIGDAGVCRAYQYALIDLAAVELQRGQINSAQQLLDEARESNRALPLDELSCGRIVKLQVRVQARQLAAAEMAAVDAVSNDIEAMERE